ncbi:hypothetical protein NADE_009057 [Nannochloris sp. 'desiccata']|nr:hypothetical protein NADE_009057 [Chlorella desiccata (nom. nud.)]
MSANALHSPCGGPSSSSMMHNRHAICSSTHCSYQPSRTFHPRRRELAPPLHVTNQGKEMRVAKMLEDAGLIEDDYIIVDPENPIPNPELGPLERRVSTTFEEGLIQEEIDTEAMKFWFTEPEEGWNREKRRLKRAQVVPSDDVDEFRHADTTNRRPLADFKPGDILRGTVVKQMLYHGFQIDVGAEADALMWISELEEWQRLGTDAPEIGDSIEVVVHAVRDDIIFRAPLQVMPTDPQLVALWPAAENHIPPLDLRDVTLAELPDVAKRSGRKWEPQTVIVPFRDNPVGKSAYEEWEVTEEQLLEMDDIV